MSSEGLKEIRKAVRTADRLLYEMTGTHLRTVVKKGITLGAEAISRRAFEDVSETDPLYAILGVRPDADDVVVKAAYKALSREYEPETGIHPDNAKFIRIVSAYRDVMMARLADEGGELPPGSTADE